MPYPPPITALNTESDVEQKLLFPLLAEPHLLAFHLEEVKTKEYLAPLEIDKGAGKKVGYYPDYSVVLAGLPVLVVEAKNPDEAVEEGYRQARLYATELNARFPTGVNPVRVVVASNGHELLYSAVDENNPTSIKLAELVPGTSVFETFRQFASRTALQPHAVDIRSHLTPPFRWKALRGLGGPAKWNVELPPNRFTRDLVPLLRRYLAADAVRPPKEIVERAYCTTRESTTYDAALEALLKDNISKMKFPLFEDVQTSKTDAPTVNEAFKKALEGRSKEQPPLALLIGGVGVGKSIFIERFYHFLLADNVKKETLWAVVDFNTAPADLRDLDHWITNAVLADLPERNGLPDFVTHQNLLRYFAPAVRELRDGPYANVAAKFPDQFEEILAKELHAWRDDASKLLRGVTRYYGGDVGKTIVVVFDNSDKRDRDQQLTIFQAVQHFRTTHRCFAILSMRDETFDRYRNEPPLDAFLKPFAFRINPPRFLDIVKRRLELMIEDLTSRTSKKLSFSLPNGVVVEYPNSDLGHYLFGVYKSLFHPNRKLRVILEALAGRDVRQALEMFASILMSGHMTDDVIFSARYSAHDSIDLPEWLVIRILMRTKYQYFSDEHGYVLNLFGVDELSKTTTNYLLPEILTHLSKVRKRQGELGIEGYVRVSEIVSELGLQGYLEEDVLWGIEKLLGRRLVVADHQRLSGATRDDYVKITASGYYHLNFLLERIEYLVGVSVDTPLRDKDIVDEICWNGDLKDDRHERNGRRRFDKVRALVDGLEREAGYRNEQCIFHASGDVAKEVLDRVHAALVGRPQLPSPVGSGHQGGTKKATSF